MFDLESEIRSWREQFASTGKLSPSTGDKPDALDELESHLREEFDRLVSSGKTQQDAWNQAIEKLGQPAQIAREFHKLQQSESGQRHWLPAWIISSVLALGITLVAFRCFSRVASGRFTMLLATHVVAITAGYTAVFAIGFMGICAAAIRAASGWNDEQDAALRRAGARLALFAAAATLIGCILGALWAHENMGRWWGWDNREIGGLCVLAWSCIMARAFTAKEASAQARICLAVISSQVVAVSWFEPFLPDGAPSHASSPTSIGMFLGAFLIVQMALVYLTLLPARSLPHDQVS
jgi:hypothetical protein